MMSNSLSPKLVPWSEVKTTSVLSVRPRRSSLSRRAVCVLAVIGLIAAGFATGYAFGRQSDWSNNSSVRVVMRYDGATDWFEVWEGDVLATEWTATELGIEGVPDPDGWSRPK